MAFLVFTAHLPSFRYDAHAKRLKVENEIPTYSKGNLESNSVALDPACYGAWLTMNSPNET